MRYKVINPPKAFNDPYNSSKKEVIEYFKWFIKEKENRISILEKAVNSVEGFNGWKADLTPESLEVFKKWLPVVIKLRDQTKKECELERSKLSKEFQFLDVGGVTLDNVALSILFDVGIYLGEVLLKNNNDLKWALFDEKKYIGTNNPVVSGFGKTNFNPRLIMQNQGGRAAAKKPVDLVALYNRWVKMIE